jgi:hypothetical protein
LHEEQSVLQARIEHGFVIPAQAGIPFSSDTQSALGSRLRGNDSHLFFEIGCMQSSCRAAA